MSEQIKGTYLCLLDNVQLEENIIGLEEFTIRYYSANELSSLLRGSDDTSSNPDVKARLEVYEKFPWAHLEKIRSAEEAKDSMKRLILSMDLRFRHAGLVSWAPFTELIRTLNLLKQSSGPVIATQFYHRPYENIQTADQIEKVIYTEPTFNAYDNDRGYHISPLLFEYDLEKKDCDGFSKLREQLNKCLSKEAVLCNSHLRTAIHYFEKGDKSFKAKPLIGSFNAIDPLMAYDAALEALVILESERSNTRNNLSSRISVVLGEKVEDVRNFLNRVFWLRSKVAHGARTIEEIERLIIHKSNEEIKDTDRNITIPEGNYEKLFLSSFAFPGFLVNLREITRRTIRFFCDEFSKENDREKTIDNLKSHN